MFTLYNWLKFIHILMAIIAVGFNATYGILLARAGREPEHESFTLRLIKVLDDRFANPAYGVLLITGLWMVFIGPWELTTFWILTALIIYGVLAVAGIALYSPLLRRQTEVLEREGPASAGYRRLAKRGQRLGMTLGVLVVGIVFLMVLKPTL